LGTTGGIAIGGCGVEAGSGSCHLFVSLTCANLGVWRALGAMMMHAIGNEHMLAAFRYGWGRGVGLRLILCKSSYSGFFWEMGMYHGNYHYRYQQQSVMTLTHA